ncbi:MAG: bifunctional 5,10-methylenetetrahydrofolate dehydrogenase/5,10-methenyltetrahydrofolate cyclohydrolase [Erysipelotrichales bacterium]|nr:bifunctional 5,10-methylenetetrahydrofolate dehydrogenase/5,10-methenyltetrahydrofolate cyclohydrolase [Erysipelotrichales bacterium]
MAEIINGLEISKAIKLEVKEKLQTHYDEGKRKAKLSVIIVGNDSASHTYVRSIAKTMEANNVVCDIHMLDEETSEKEVIYLIENLNNDETVDGIFLQIPLPKHINSANVTENIHPAKDVDGLSPKNLGKLIVGRDCYVPCTPQGIMHLLKTTGIELEGKQAVMVGRSMSVGKPMVSLLEKENATVTLCHSKTKNLQEVTKQADILVVAVGRPHMITADYIKTGAVVIDVGINVDENGKIIGDVDFDDVFEKVSYITPVPRGVGPMTNAALLKNVLKAYER